MVTLQSIINSGDPREIKRALAVQMQISGIETIKITKVLDVSEQFVSKWKLIFERESAESLLLKYKGKKSYLSKEEHSEIVKYITEQTTLSVEQLRDYIEKKYDVLYSSKQSYYDLLSEGNMSWHKAKKINPKKDEQKVIEKREEIKKNWRHTNKK